MGLFNKNKKQGVENASQSTVGRGQQDALAVKTKKKRVSAMMSKFRDTAWDAVEKDLADGSYVFLNGECYIGAMLTEDVLKSVPAKDEALGGFMSLVNRGVIKTIITPESKADGYIVLLLDKLSLSLLEDSPFIWQSSVRLVNIGKDGWLEPLDRFAAFPELLAFAEGEAPPLAVAAGGDDDDDAYGYDSEHFEDDSVLFDSDAAVFGEGYHGDDESEDGDTFNGGESELSYDDVYGDEIPLDELPPAKAAYGGEVEHSMHEGDFDDAYFGDEHEDGAESEVFGEEFDGIGFGGDFGESEDLDVPGIPEPTPDVVEAVVSRVFSQGDLDLSVDPRQFDSQFPPLPQVVFRVDRRASKGSDGVLESHLNYLSEQANSALESYYSSHRRHLSEKYVSMMADACSYIADSLSVENPSTDAGKRYKNANDWKQKHLQDNESEIRARVDDLNREWNLKVEEAAETAAAVARQQYKSRHGRLHEDALARIREDVQRSVESRFQSSLVDLHGDRRRKAMQMFDAIQSRIFLKLSDEHKEILAKEQEMRDGFAKNLELAVQDSYKDEAIRIEVLEREMNQKQEAVRVREEYEARLAALESELARRTEAHTMHTTMAKDLHNKIFEISKANDDYYLTTIKMFEAKEQTLRDELAAAHRVSDENFEKKAWSYREAIGALKEQVEISKVNMRRHNRLSMVLIVVLAVAFLAIGILMGSYLRIERLADLFVERDTIIVQTEGVGDDG